MEIGDYTQEIVSGVIKGFCKNINVDSPNFEGKLEASIRNPVKSITYEPQSGLSKIRRFISDFSLNVKPQEFSKIHEGLSTRERYKDFKNSLSLLNPFSKLGSKLHSSANFG